MERSNPVSLLFVCLGNICRSPTAEAVMTALIAKEGLASQIVCDSAGTIGYHAGNPADARMRRHCQKRGYEATSISRPVETADFARFDLILGMDKSNVADLEAMVTNEEERAKIHLMMSFAPDRDYREVPDPYYGGEAGFSLVIDLLEEACAGLLRQIREGRLSS